MAEIDGVRLAAVLSAAMLQNDLVVMRAVYREVEAGLGTRGRDAAGAWSGAAKVQ